jgi:hypothetical protein
MSEIIAISTGTGTSKRVDLAGEGIVTTITRARPSPEPLCTLWLRSSLGKVSDLYS